MKCRPHVWNVEKWLPIFKGADITVPEIECLNCGRVLHVRDTSPNMRASICEGIASRLFEGDEYEEVQDAVSQYFSFHIEAQAASLRVQRGEVTLIGLDALAGL